MKILWFSSNLRAQTGYGIISKQIVSRLLSKHEIICAGEAESIVWGSREKLLLPNGRKVLQLAIPSPLGNRDSAISVMNAYVAKYRPDLILGFSDCFGLEFLNEISFPFAAYIPVDGILHSDFLLYTRDAVKVIAYSKFGYEELLRIGAEASRLALVPHGVDTKVFRPLKEDKAKLRRALGKHVYPPIPEDCFLFMSVGTNLGDRKKLPLLMETFSKLPEKAHLLLHTNANAGFPNGYNLPIWASRLGIESRIHWPGYNVQVEPFPDGLLNLAYNSADCYVSNSAAEGFSVPLIESAASGIPAIAPANSAQVELVQSRGYLVRCIEGYHDIPVYVPFSVKYLVPDQNDLLRKMVHVYENLEECERLGRNSRIFALTYDWDMAVIKKWEALIESLSNELL